MSDLPSGFGVGWEAHEVCPFEHQGDPDRRGGIVIGHDLNVVVMREFRQRVRQQSIPIANLDPDRFVRPRRRDCHRAARTIAAAIGRGKGDLDDEDRMWIRVAHQLGEIR